MAGQFGDEQAADYRAETSAPGDLSEADLAACVRVIDAGGAVAVDLKKLKNAKLLAVVRRGKEIVGVGSIKRIRTGYASGIANKSGYAFPAETPELGYIAVAPEHRRRGLSHRLVAALLEAENGGLFATTYDDRMKKTLDEAGFTQEGREWRGRERMLSLWIKK